MFYYLLLLILIRCVFWLCPTLGDPWTVVRQVPLSMEFSRQEYWSGLPFPPPGDLSDPGIEPNASYVSCIGSRFFSIGTTWEALYIINVCVCVYIYIYILNALEELLRLTE